MKKAPSFSDLLDQFAPHLQGKIVDNRELIKLTLLSEQLLASLPTEVILFELPLKGVKKWVDLSIVIDSARARLTQSKQSPKERLPRKIYERCFHVISKYKLERGYYGIELDIGSQGSASATPNLFFCATNYQDKKLIHFISELIEELEGKRLSQTCLDNLFRYIDICSSMGDQIFACGIMLARPNAGVRMHSSLNLSRDLTAIEQRLKKIGYERSVQKLTGFLNKFPIKALSKIGLALDIGEKIGPRVGIERFEEGRNLAQNEWAPLLDLLIQEKLASKEKVEACLQWVGASRQNRSFDHDSLFMRKISHLKLVFQPDKALQAKIYLHAQWGLLKTK